MTLLPSHIDQRAKGLKAELVWSGTHWAEGPCWLPTEGKLLFSDVISSSQYLLDPATRKITLFRHHSCYSNGNALDHVNKKYYGFYPLELEDLSDYIILTCEHGRRCVSASVPPHAIERYIAAHGNDSSKSAGRKRGREEEEDGLTRATASVPPYMMITNRVVTEKIQDFRFNSPNDIVIRPTDGTLWFTDPPYGIISNKEGYQAGSQMNGCHVYCLYPPALCRMTKRTGKDGKPLPLLDATARAQGDNADVLNRLNETHQVLRIAVSDLIRPNGLAFSPDSSKLYVAECSANDYNALEGLHEIRVYDVVEGDTRTYTAERRTKEGEVEEATELEYKEVKAINGRVFCQVSPGIPDGLRLDADGYVYTSSANAIIVYAPDGTEVNRIHVPQVVSNCSFGGEDGRDLYVTANHAIYRIQFPKK